MVSSRLQNFDRPFFLIFKPVIMLGRALFICSVLNKLVLLFLAV